MVEKTPVFDFENELKLLGLSETNYKNFKENDSVGLSQYDEELLQKIYVLQEKTLNNMTELGLEDSKVLLDAMRNLLEIWFTIELIPKKNKNQ